MAGLIGGCDELARLVRQRYDEAVGGDIRMNCDTCAYRVALPGFTDKVGRPQVPHDHPDEEEHRHAADSYAARPDGGQYHAANMNDGHRHEHAAHEVLS